MIFVVVRGSFSELFWSIFDAHLHSKIALGFKEAFIRYIGGQKTFHAYKINVKVQKGAHCTRILVFLERESFLLTPYITNESLLEAKSNFGVQVSIKNGPKKLRQTTPDYHENH